MSFSRALVPAVAPEPDALTAAMVGIGMGFAAPAARAPNIEDTLLFASVAAMEQHDLRVLAVLVTWFGVHCPFVNADRLCTNRRGKPVAPRARAVERAGRVAAA